jgi:predicted RNA binding protein YcfA (HicA-like mRNA interferase family)
MSLLPQVRGERLIAALAKAGFRERRRTGSHAVLVDEDGRTAIVPVHGSRALPAGTLHAILRGIGLSLEELRELLEVGSLCGLPRA